LLSAGARNQEIAQRLTISVNTTKYHLENIYRKLGVQTRTEAARFARETGVLD
jgi:LuxR family maltose regulon positive regulatory protein